VTSAGRRAATATLGAAVALDMAGFVVVLPLVPVYAMDLGVQASTVAALVSSFALARTAGAALLARVAGASAIGRPRLLLVVGLLGMAAGAVVAGVVGDGVAVLVGRALQGVSGAAVLVARDAVAAATPGRRERSRLLLSWRRAAAGGAVLGAVIAAGGERGPGGPLVALAALAAVLAVAAARTAVPLDRRAGAEARRSDTAATVDPPPPPDSVPWEAVRWTLVAFLASVVWTGFAGCLALLLDRRFDLGIAAIALAIAASWLVLGVARDVKREASWSPSWVAVVGLGALAVGMALAGTVTGRVALLPALVLVAGGQGLVVRAAGHGVRAAVLDEATARFVRGWLPWAAATAWVVGPAAGARLFDVLGVSAPFLAGAVVAVAALLLALASPEPASSRRGARPASREPMPGAA